MTQHKTKLIGPSQREAGICRGARARFLNRDWITFWVVYYHCQHNNQESRYLPCYAHYRRFPNRIVKFIPPNHQQAHSTANPKQRVPSKPATALGEFCLIIMILSMGLGIPITNHFLMNDERSPLIVRITHLAWKILTTPSRHMSDSGIQNRLLFEGLEFGTCKFTWNGR